MISLEYFQKLDIRVGEVKEAAAVAGSKNLFLLKVSLGKEERQIVSGLAGFYQPEELLGKQVILLANLEPRIIFGLESQGMLLAVDSGAEVALLTPDRKVTPGSPVK